MLKVSRILKASSLLAQIKQLSSEFVQAAQQEYDAWDQSDEENGDPLVGFGGICQEIAEAFQNICSNHGIESTSVDSNGVGDQHVWCVAYLDDEAYAIDIPPHVYENGAGYTWYKKPNVTFSVNDLDIYATEVPDSEW